MYKEWEKVNALVDPKRIAKENASDAFYDLHQDLMLITIQQGKEENFKLKIRLRQLLV